MLDSIVSVVDALRIRDEFALGDDLDATRRFEEEDLASLVIQQIEFCNIILLNKASEVSEDELQHITAVLRAIQPHAEIIPCDYCDVDLDKLLNTDLFHFDEVAGSARWIEAVEADADEDEELGEAYEYGIDTFVYYRRRPFDLGLFDEFVARHWPKSVIRCKGMCYFSEEYDMCYLFEQAGKQLGIKQCGQFIATMPKDELEVELATDPQLRRDWDEQYGDRMQKLVFIGQNMDKKAITAALDACLAEQGVTNVNACIGVPSCDNDPYVDRSSVNFHARMGYRAVGEFSLCASKFGRWYNMVWMEKHLLPHLPEPERIKRFDEVRDVVREKCGIV